MIGFNTSTNAGPIPLHKPATPCFDSINRTVSMSPIFFTTLGFDVDDEGSGIVRVCVAWVVCTTQIGFTRIEVAEPAMVPEVRQEISG